MTDESQALPIRGLFTGYGRTIVMEPMTPTATPLESILILLLF